MARNQRELTVAFKGDTGDLTRAANESEQALHGVGKAASGPGGLLSKLTPVVDPIQLIGQGLQFAASMAFDFAEAASADAKSAAQVAGVMRNVTHATEAQIRAADDWLSRLSLTVAIADDDLRPAFSRLIAATGDVGKAQSELTIALDIAAGTGKDFNAVADAMVKAQNGNVGAFGRLGIATKDAQGNQLTLNQILDTAQQKWGGLAAQVANTDPMAKAQIAFGELQESLGKFLLPVLQTAVDLFNEKVYPALQAIFAKIHDDLAPVIRDTLKPAWDDLKKSVDELLKSLEPLFGKMSAGELIVAGLHAAILELAAVMRVVAFLVGLVTDSINALTFGFKVIWSTIAGPLVSIFGTLVGWFNTITGAATSTAESIVGAWQWLSDTVSGLVDPIRDAWNELFSWIRRIWNNTIGKLSFHIPGTDIGFDVPDIPGGRAAPAGGMSAVGAGGIVINMPTGTDGHAVVAALRTYGLRVGGLDLTAGATR